MSDGARSRGSHDQLVGQPAQAERALKKRGTTSARTGTFA